MIFFGAVQERYERPGGFLWPFWAGCVVGSPRGWRSASPLVARQRRRAAAFVYAIFVSLFVFFNVFAINMWLQYRRIGRWRTYAFGETATSR